MARIVHVLRRFVPEQWGGTETVVTHLCRQQRLHGHAVEILCTSALSKPGRDEVQGLPVVRFPYIYPLWPLSPEDHDRLDGKGGNPVCLELGRYLRRGPRPDLIHLHTAGRIGAVVRSAARRQVVPYVVSFHGGYFDVPAEEQALLASVARGKLDWGKPLGWWFGARRLMRDAAALLYVNPADAEQSWAAIPRTPAFHLPNGVELDRWTATDPGPFLREFPLTGKRVVLCVARIDPQKDQMTLVRAFRELAASERSAHLVLIGPVSVPGYDADIRGVAERLGVADQVTLIPGLPVGSPLLPAAYQAAEVCVLPSRHEPFGIAVLEAWAARRPVVAASTGGLTRLVQHRHNGLLFPPGDYRKLGRLLLRLMRRPGLAGKMADRGHATAVDQYSWPAIAARLEAVYESIWNKRRDACSLRPQTPWPCEAASLSGELLLPAGPFTTSANWS